MDNILSDIETSLMSYNPKELEIAQNYIKKSLSKNIKKSIELELCKEENKLALNSVLVDFKKQYSYFNYYKLYYELKNGEWENISVDNLYEKWCEYLRSFIFKNETYRVLYESRKKSLNW